ncbi:MAG: tRNA epoxyqueuosine(34) reductase QueG [Salibacteraceae bacterium]
MESFDLKLFARSEWVKKCAAALEFDDCRVAKADFLEDEARFLEQWLSKQKHGEMAYLENHFDKRTDPRKLVDGAKSVIVLTLNYYPEKKQRNDAPQISKYAYGRDYHKVIRKRLNKLLIQLNEQFGAVEGRGFVDSAPVMEKAWAQRAGIGWMGKHTNILTKQRGSFYFLAVLIVDIELATDHPVTDHCGECTACIDACPTNAIEEAYQLDASKCISYFTIELKDEVLPKSYHGKFQNWMFGCDICQDVCPWNRFSEPHTTSDFVARKELLSMDQSAWEHLSNDEFEKLFSGSAVRRTKYQGLMRNIKFLSPLEG